MNIIKKIIKSLFFTKYKILRFFRIILNIDQKIFIGERKIILPPGHMLSLYNLIYKEYDEFLPKLALNIKKNESIIDIGANVGDTLFRLINKNLNPDYYCVEADDYFFKYLKKNIESLNLNKNNKIIPIKALVGNNLVGNLSNNNTGTKHLVESSSGISSKKLDDLITEYQIKNIKLIKVDVDGYDYSVLLSALIEISKHKPDLFFEYMILDDAGFSGYSNLMEKLNKIGYSKWTVLNNYGSVILENKAYLDVLELINSFKNTKVAFDIYCKT